MAKKKFSDDDVFESDGLLRDGAVFRVPMQLRDGRMNPNLTPMQRAVAASKLADGGDPLSLHRPGHRTLARDNDGELTRDGRREALQAYDQRLTNAWRTPTCDDDGDDDDDDNGIGSGEFFGGQPGDPCTVRGDDYPDDFGSPGTLQMSDDGGLVCVPNSLSSDSRRRDARRDSRKPVRDDRARALAERDAGLRDAWRNGK